MKKKAKSLSVKRSVASKSSKQSWWSRLPFATKLSIFGLAILGIALVVSIPYLSQSESVGDTRSRAAGGERLDMTKCVVASSATWCPSGYVNLERTEGEAISCDANPNAATPTPGVNCKRRCCPIFKEESNQGGGGGGPNFDSAQGGGDGVGGGGGGFLGGVFDWFGGGSGVDTQGSDDHGGGIGGGGGSTHVTPIHAAPVSKKIPKAHLPLFCKQMMATITEVGYPEDATERQAFRKAFLARRHELEPIWGQVTQYSGKGLIDLYDQKCAGEGE